MKEDIKNLWVDALRSGEYNQTKASLQDEGYCCLGVLCKVGEKEGILVNTNSDGKLEGVSLSDQGSITEWSGASYFDQSGVQNILMGMNDDDGKTFEEIADHIDNHWEKI